MNPLDEFRSRLRAAFGLPDGGGFVVGELEGPVVAEVWRLGDKRLVRSSQPDEALAQACADPALDDPALVRWVAEVVGGEVGEVVAYRSAATQRPVEAGDLVPTRQLGQQDREQVASLLAACTTADRDEAEVSLDDELCVGAHVDSGLVAMATMFGWNGFRDIGVLTHPGHRRRGAARAAVTALILELDDEDDSRPALYRHDQANTGSARLADSLALPLGAVAYEIRP